MAFVLASMNNSQVCVADVSTAFLCGKTREKVHIKAGKEFGEHAGKMLSVDKGIHGLQTSAARFHEACRDFTVWELGNQEFGELI